MASSCRIPALLLLFSLALLTVLARCSNNQTDYLSLLTIKHAIHDPSGALISWNEQAQFCSWKGIRCSRRHPDRVVVINLKSQGLVGSLSPSIGNMSFLREINLRNNSFHGAIPDQIGCLRRLQRVEFSNNSFSGVIPRNLSHCSNLVYLNLIDNYLSGIIPLEFSSLYKIQKLGLGLNKVSGHIPPFFGNLTSLTQLGLDDCNLIGEIPVSLGQLRNMKYLLLSENSFTGSIPSSLFNISTLSVLNVFNNYLHGSIPSDIGYTLPNLFLLDLERNKFTGAVPSFISNTSSLVDILLSDNYFTGPMPMLGRLSRLGRLLIASNPLQDDISFISSLANCTNLEVLEMSDSQLTGALPESMANLSSHLSFLNIPGNQVHGNLPVGIGNLIGLTYLSLHGNNLQGFIPWSMGKLSNLQYLSLGANAFDGELPFSFGNLSSLNSMRSNMNQLSGSIPKSLNQCTHLLELDLSHNNFSGPIPPEIMTLSSISVMLDISYNALTHSLPSVVHSLIHLSALDLSNNRLSGVLPSSLSGCTSLVRLDLQGNLFEGEIPQRLSALTGLLNLDLSRNNFSGSIPSFLANLQLGRLNLSFNRLEGEVPKTGIFTNQSALSIQGNKHLCGGIEELNLPPCTVPNSTKKSLKTLLKILIPIGVATSFLCLMIFLYWNRKPKKDLSSSLPLTSPPFLRLSYADLQKATNGFDGSKLVGMGRFGSVYKGTLDDDSQTLVAVKVLNLLVRGAAKSFMKECNALRHARHRNLLKILSVCESIDFKGNDFKSLIYEFKDNGNLEKWLNLDAEFCSDIIQRLNIAIDVAQALEYLHCGTESITVHGDLKPSNVLLDHDMTAYVGDFGLAKIISSIVAPQESSSSMRIQGTVGYIPPEYSTSSVISTRGDVYSYGVLLLEMFTNKKPTDEEFKDHLNLHNFVAARLPDCIEEIIGSLVQTRHDMDDDKVKDLLASVLSIGVDCSKENPKDRIAMTEVVNKLHKIKDYYFG